MVACPRADGSAVIVDTRDPERTVILDGATGSVRATYPRPDPAVEEWQKLALFDAPASVSCAGLVALVSAGTPGAGAPRLVAVNATTGLVAWEAAPDPTGEESPGSALSEPLLAGGALVAPARSEETIRAWIPGLAGGSAPLALAFDREMWSAQGQWRNLDDDSRLLSCGDTIYVLRTDSNPEATAGAFRVDRDAVAHEDRGAVGLWLGFEFLLREASREPGSRRYPHLVAARTTMDGLWVLAGYLGAGSDASEGVAVWIPRRADLAPVRRYSLAATVGFGQGPARVGSRMLLPVDDGYLVVPLAPGSDR